jgi:hypothetical protein
MKICIWLSTSPLEAQIWKLVAWSWYLNLQSSSPRELKRKWEKSKVSLVNHGVRHHENGESNIWVCICGRTRIFLVPIPSGYMLKLTDLCLGLEFWSLKLALLHSLSGYHYKQERKGEMFKRLHFLWKGKADSPVHKIISFRRSRLWSMGACTRNCGKVLGLLILEGARKSLYKHSGIHKWVSSVVGWRKNLTFLRNRVMRLR